MIWSPCSLQASAFGILLFMSLILFQDDPVYKMNLADLKSEASKAYNEKDYSTAVKFYSVVCCMHDALVLSPLLSL